MPEREWNEAQRERMQRLARRIYRDEVEGNWRPDAPVLRADIVPAQTMRERLEAGETVQIPEIVQTFTHPDEASRDNRTRGYRYEECTVWWNRRDYTLSWLEDGHWTLLGPDRNYELRIHDPEDLDAFRIQEFGGTRIRLPRPRHLTLRCIEAEVNRRIMFTIPEGHRPTVNFLSTNVTAAVEAMTGNATHSAVRRQIENSFDQAGQLLRFVAIVHGHGQDEAREILSGPFSDGTDLMNEIHSLTSIGCEYRIVGEALLAHEARTTCTSCFRPAGFLHQKVCPLHNSAQP